MGSVLVRGYMGLTLKTLTSEMQTRAVVVGNERCEELV